MSDFLQPGVHPDPDSLNAFVEGVLPEHERLVCLAHLAECTACREVVNLLQDTLPAEELPAPFVPEKTPFWKRWLMPVPALSAAMMTGILVMSVWFYQHRTPAVPGRTQELIAVAPARENPAPVMPEVRSMTVPRQEKRRVPSRPDDAPIAAAPPLIALDGAAPASTPVTTVPDPQSAIAGTITDATGAAIAGATVRVRPVASPAGLSFTSDQTGQFKAAGLEPGQYELQVGAGGFQSITKQVEVQPQQIARADSRLDAGSVSESIAVTAQVAAVPSGTATPVAPLPERGSAGGRGGRGGGGGGRAAPASARTSPSSVSMNAAATFATEVSTLQPLPVKPADQTVTNGKRMLRRDSAGALFLSEDSGKRWKAVKAAWQGKVANLVALPISPPSSEPIFQLTTDSGAVWLSRDGSHWYDSAKK